MERLVAILSPRSRADFVGKVLLLVLMFGVMNLLRDVMSSGDGHDSLLNNTYEAAFVSLPFVIITLAAFRHLHDLQEKLLAQASTDMLTGLPNRRAFIQRMDGAMARHTGGIVMMLDVDHFKRVNDTFGHDLGDFCLQELAAFFRQNLRAGDMVARMGGEEFAIMLNDIDITDALTIAKRLSQGCTVNVGRQDVRVTLSIGVTERPVGTLLDNALTRADGALYRAKADGRACARVAEPDVAEQGGAPRSKRAS